MVRFGMVAAALALMASPLLAQESTDDLKKELEQLRKEVDSLKAVNSTKEVPAMGKIDANAMAADDSPIVTLFKGTKLSGFIDTGYQFSFNQLHASTANFGAVGNNPIRLFDFADNAFYLNNAQIQLERLATKDMIVGYHIEIMSGSDVRLLNQTNHFDMTIGLQEAWLQVLAPLGNGLDIRVGRMATLIGYEVVENTNNLNYTRGVLFSQIEPTTVTGVRASYSFMEQLSASIGFNNGPNNAFFLANDVSADENHGKMFEAQVMVKPMKDLWASLSINIGNDTEFSGSTADKFYIFNIAVGYTMDKLTVAANFDQASQQGVGNEKAGSNRAAFRGLALYAKYQVTDVFATGVRWEYFSDMEGANFTTGVGTGARFCTYTFTQELKVAQHLILRIELRADSSNHQNFNRDNGSSAAKGDYTLGFEALLPF